MVSLNPNLRDALRTQILKVVLNRNNTLAGKLLDLCSAVLLPIGNISVISDSERSTGKDNCADIIIMASSSYSLLVGLWCTSLISQDEAGTNPHGRSTEHESRSNSLAVIDATSSNDLYRSARHWASLALDEIDNGGNQNSCGNIAGMSSSLTTLCTDDIDAEIEALLNVLGVSNHVHVRNASFMEAFDDMLGRNANGGDKELGAAVNDDAHKLVEFAFRIIITI